jgi:hypothetical protein
MVTFPFVVAAVLNLLVSIARPIDWHTEHVAGYCLLFWTPRAWAPRSRMGFGTQSRTVNTILVSPPLLLIPAALYAGCLFMISVSFDFGLPSLNK